MPRKRMIHSLEFKRGKTIDLGLIPMSKSEMKIFDDADKRKKEGKEIMFQYEPSSLMMKISLDVKKDRRGNVMVKVKLAKKGYCHRWDCSKKAKKDYVLCTNHLKLKKKK